MRRALANCRIALALCALVLLAACGHRFAVTTDARGDDVMLLGHDPVAYFTVGRPIRGNPQIRERYQDVTFYFANEANRTEFRRDPAKYFPQYGGFCSSGAAYGLKLGHDPTEFEIVGGKIYFFGDVLGHEAWKIDAAWNIARGDEMWPEAKDEGWRYQSLRRYASKVSWYKDTRAIREDWTRKNPGRSMPVYDTGGMVTNLFLRGPGWRAREGFGQPVVGLVGTDACPPACAGEPSYPFGQTVPAK